MRTSFLVFIAPVCVTATVGCAAQRPPAGAPSAGVVVSPPAVTEPDSRPVSAPAGLVLVGRVRGYREVLALSSKPPLMNLLESKLAEEEPILADLDLTQPVEFAVVYDRNFRRRASAPPPPPEPEPNSEETTEDEDADAEPEPEPPRPSPEDHVLAAISLPLARFAPQSYAERGFSLSFGNAYAHDGCLVAESRGSAPARLICADHPDVARALHDYLTRGLPLEPLSSSPIFAEFRPAPLKPFWEPARAELNDQLKVLGRLGGPTARAAEEIAVSLLQESDAWVASLESVRFEAGPNARGEFQASARLTVKSPEPWLVQSYLETASAVRGAPPEFLSLPKDVRSAGYAYGMSESRAALLQTAIVQLAKNALSEYGPPSRTLGASSKPGEAQAMDRAVSELMRTLDSPCFRAPRSVWAAGAGGPMPTKKPFAVDAVVRSALGYYLVAIPSASRCDALLASFLDTLAGLQKAMPAKVRREFPLTLSLGKTTQLPGLGKAITHRITLSQKTLREFFDESKKKLDAKEANKNQWAAPKGPLTLTLFVLPNANGAGSDWFAFGLDEKVLKEAFSQLFHPAPGATLASQPKLAPFLAKNPLSFSYGSFLWQSQWMQALMAQDESKAMAVLSGLFDGLTFTGASHVVRRGASTEATLDYYVSPEGLNGLRTLLGWDLARFDQLSKELDAASEKKP